MERPSGHFKGKCGQEREVAVFGIQTATEAWDEWSALTAAGGMGRGCGYDLGHSHIYSLGEE